jgi:hypothetical protein
MDRAPRAGSAGEGRGEPTSADRGFRGLILRPLDPGLHPAVRALAEHLRTLLDPLEISVRRYAARHHYDAGTVSRFLSGERLPPEEFIDTLEREAATRRGRAITGQAQERAHKLYLDALRAHNRTEA